MDCLENGVKEKKNEELKKTANKKIDKNSEKLKKNKKEGTNNEINKNYDIIKMVRGCQNDDNIFDFINVEYKKKYIKKGINNTSENINETNLEQKKSGYIFFESINSYELKKYKTSDIIFNMLVDITKNNMENLYNESNFLNKGWSNLKKQKEFMSNKCKLILGFKNVAKSEEKNEKKNDEKNEGKNMNESGKNDTNGNINSEHDGNCPENNINKAGKINFINVLKSDNPEKVEEYLKENKLVCFVHYRIIPDYYPYEKNIICYLYEIQIIPDFKGVGIGSHLIYMLESLCKSIKINKILCTVLKNNINAVAFYKKKCLFEMDENSPDNFDTENSKPCEYEILKKEIIL
ncbi:N-acetyltransferase, GNAT family, putative [Plasmodium chabaudi chabaudi]|uniref:N-alpha-acetyltransferase 40 n=1 Tax=Plasmodium chabaudi chabaudi TaxID=31271 RepID=A0A4V0KAW9_PLACU|nr:N-acetyltransferase, GNAT family, putative [Plasmodium chabaudi chabaudi]VTZ70383.1 N-acetyltransferase, GNAT family, putative [Plasmodium chabaudi chabaudi]|eukprot:XP_737935.2 acetyltransferase, GNAT family, putative [Plasmodium chabaudi chabaudi]